MGNQNRARTRAVKAQMVASGQKWTAAAREVDAGGDVSPPASLTWPEAVGRLNAMTYVLSQALDILDPLGIDDEDFQPRMSPTLVDEDAWLDLLVTGDTASFPRWRSSLPGALYAYREGEMSGGPGGYDRGRDLLARAMGYHRMWIVEQVWALITAAASGAQPVRLPIRLPASPYEIAPWWNPPLDAHTILDRLPASPERDKVHGAISDMEHALHAQEDLSEWIREIRDGHDCEPDEDGDGRCDHEFGPAEHEVDEWNALENDAAGYELAMTGLCFAARELIAAHVAAAAG